MQRVLLDGGVATELERRGKNLTQGALWSARCIQTDAEELAEVHIAYLRAGAHVISSSTYQAFVLTLQRELALSPHGARALVRRGVEIAVQARDLFVAEQRQAEPHSPEKHARFVAASTGPYGAFLADGSEYVGKYGGQADSVTALKAFHRTQIECFVGTRADLVLFETVPNANEIQAIGELMNEPEFGALPYAISLQCRVSDAGCSLLADGSPVSAVVTKLVELDRFGSTRSLCAIGVNCVSPNDVKRFVLDIRAGIQEAQQSNTSADPTHAHARETRAFMAFLASRTNDARLPFVMSYPNSGEVYNAGSKTWQWPYLCSQTGDFDSETNRIEKWRELQLSSGAEILGGCCRTTPAFIHALGD
ncbi:Homocysteine S-methyltransferase [Porphyridium purpureum]|uniref:Homocysteine S-methyltransferase n=1 Tax=Porphyridium purpureum TaxID=35688 RepID=A0A5J4Z130_PORPP|nr:Homocysteine S-methyltransferase [Porphyridium purpureum]|eukprot:POR1487..scf208_2